MPAKQSNAGLCRATLALHGNQINLDAIALMLANVPFRRVPSVQFPISCLGAGRANPVKVIRIFGGTSHLVGRANAHLIQAARRDKGESSC